MRQYLEDGLPNDVVYERAFACMDCFKCTENVCPQGLDPLAINALIRGSYFPDKEIKTVEENTHPKRVLASIQVTPGDYERLFTPTPVRKASMVFFPGCTVYVQPEMLLTALDILAMIDADMAFLPGLDDCCGGDHLYYGDIATGDQRADALVSRLSAYQPEQVVLWCPTCHVRFEKYLSAVMELPFEVISMPQYLAAHLDRLPLEGEIDEVVTLHEACKAAYTGVDVDGVRSILKQLPGLQLVEMPRHAEQAVCCGGGALPDFSQVLRSSRDGRLEEACQTGADTLVDVCHYCHHVFSAEAHRFDVTPQNYISLLGRFLGIEQVDRYGKWRQWGDLQRVLEDAAAFIEASPYSREEIEEAIAAVVVEEGSALSGPHPGRGRE